MLREKIKNIRLSLMEAQAEKEVHLFAWVKSKRDSKNVSFLALNDGSQQQDIQCVVDSNLAESIREANTGASIKVVGIWKASPGKNQAWEIHATAVDVLGEADPVSYPLQKKGHTLEFLREISHWRPRTNTFGAVFRIRNELARLVHEFFQGRNFMWVHTPIITANDCEGAGELFRVSTLDLKSLSKTPDGKIDYSKDFFGKETHLTVSGQLEGEIFAQAVRDIYTFGPTFRAENSNTARHLAEFWMIEPEMAFADLEDDMELAESFLKHLFAGVIERCTADLQFLDQHYKADRISTLSTLKDSNFKRLTYTEAVKILTESKQSFEFPVTWGVDLQSEHERFLTDHVFNGPVFVTDYPKAIKAFYMRQNDDGRTVRAMDVLVPKVGEIIGGSQREERLEVLQQRMTELQIPTHEMQWYLDLRRYGSTPHCGFGAGFERLVQFVTGMANIRDVIPFPRVPGRIL